MIKFVGIILILICGMMTGLRASDKLKVYYKNCILLKEIVNQISIMIRYRSLNLYEISGELKRSHIFSELEFIRKLPDEFGNENFCNVWCNAVKNDNSIGLDEKELLTSFAESLGTSDIDGQISSIEMLIENLKFTEEKRRREYEEKGRLYRSLGIILSLMIGIIII